jgi:Fic family protein
MSATDADIKADIRTAEDRGEPIGLMEPMTLSEGARRRTELTDLALELATQSAAFRSSLPPEITEALATLVRSMNCYYSNLIEGHDTHPIDIERALNNEYSADPEKRDLQLEAKAHIEVQGWIDEGGIKEAPTSVAAIVEIHRRFCENLPDKLLWTSYQDSDLKERVKPGAFRDHDVKVGRLIPVSPGAIPRFLERFEEAYSKLGKTDAILAAAAAHHRLAWIHPFLDGNGRVGRLMTHAMLLRSLDTGAIWSVARGLARNESEYKSLLAACDMPRRNDLDGRGTLSEEALSAFTHFFLNICLDQVAFMRSLVEPNMLRTRILMWAEESIRLDVLPPKSGAVLEAVLYRGELPRGDVAGVLGATDRHARRITSALMKEGVLVSESQRAPLRLAFPATLASRWMPGLFPEKPRRS